MFKQTLIAPAFLAMALVAATPAHAAGADATIHEVYQAADAGRFDDAQKLMDKVLQDHPNSAKAHFVEAELLSKQARYNDAQTELNTALRLDPAQSFAKPGRVQELQSIISGSHQTRVVQHSVPAVQAAPVYVSRPQAQSSGGGGWLVIAIIFIAVFALIAMVRSAMRRTVVMSNGYGGGYAPGYGQGYGPGYGPVVGGGGMGSGILGGLATGAAVGAGIVAGEELMEHMTGHDRERDVEYIRDDRVRDDSWSNQNNDMGGNDFGVSDSSSWDSGGGGGSSDDW